MNKEEVCFPACENCKYSKKINEYFIEELSKTAGEQPVLAHVQNTILNLFGSQFIICDQPCSDHFLHVLHVRHRKCISYTRKEGTFE